MVRQVCIQDALSMPEMPDFSDPSSVEEFKHRLAAMETAARHIMKLCEEGMKQENKNKGK